MTQKVSADKMLAMLINTGHIFSSGKGFSQIFTELLDSVRDITSADGGSLYIYDHTSETLKVVVIGNKTLGISKVVDTFDALKIDGFIEVPTRIDGEPNLRTVSVCSYLQNRKILINSLDDDTEFNFNNTRQFDKNNNYETHNLLILPLVGHNNKVIGVLQLINCDKDVFSDYMQTFVDAIAGQIGTMLSNALLVNETQELMSAIIQMIGVAIDEKSPHTAGHCQRVVEITMMIVEELEKTKKHPIYKDFSLTTEQRRELRIAALLHDIGKIITPLHILDKRTKLHTVNDKISLLYERMRAWELARRLQQTEQKLREEGLEHLISSTEEKYSEDYQFLGEVNAGNVFVDEEVTKRLETIAERMIESPNTNNEKLITQQVIDSEELNNLKIKRGTLNPEERKIMEDHVSISIRLLSSIPWPSNLKRVVEIAGAHHETLNGSGYPNKLTGDDMDLPARVLGLADRFEGLSAPDRPYRNVKMTLSRVMSIMENMAEEQEIDDTLFDFFRENKLHLKYAKKHLPPELIDVQQ